MAIIGAPPSYPPPFCSLCGLQDPPRYTLLVAFLDEDDGAGWELLSQLLRGGSSALELLRHRFLSPSVAAVQQGERNKGGFTLPWS